MKATKKNPIEVLHNRFRELDGDVYCECFSVDDKKKLKEIKSEFYNIKEHDSNFINEELLIYNIGSMGVFTNLNPLNKDKRIKSNIIKIQNIFIDLDDAEDTHNELIKSFLNKEGINYFYNAQSGHGYHFLIPVDLEVTEENKVKSFLNYLKVNVCDKVDVATYTNERLLRVPESMHNKDEESKQLKTLFVGEPTKEIIETNNDKVLKLQLSQNKGETDIQYLANIKREDTFFSTILGDKEKFENHINILNQAKEKNNIFLKNLAAFIFNNKGHRLHAEHFLKQWGELSINHYKGWLSKAINNKYSVNYYELLTWARKYGLKEWVELLEEQLKTCFLDKYEFYYLEDEGKESNYLLYYPEKDYFVQKSITQLLDNVYYACLEEGIDLEKEFGLNQIKDWEDYSFNKQETTKKNMIEKKIIEEKRRSMVFNINYEPNNSKFVYHDGKKYFNTYTKSGLIDYYNKEKEYHFPHIKELIENLTGDNEDNYKYFCKWLAWIIKNPTEKLPTAIILQGQQGSGKGTFKNLILDQIFGSSNVQEINQTHLESSFNSYLLGKQIIVANEVMHNENRQTLPNVLKNLVTDPEITINRKFKKEIIAKNYTHWIFCTNSDNPIKIDKDDRRYSVFYSNKLKGGGKAAAKFVQELRINLDYELKQFISYLKDLEVNFYDVHEPIMTDAKKEIIDINKDSVELFLETLKDYNSIYELFIKNFGSDNELEIIGEDKKYIKTESFFKVYSKWCENNDERGKFKKANFSKKLSSYGIKSSPRKYKDGEAYKSAKGYDLELVEALMVV